MPEHRFGLKPMESVSQNQYRQQRKVDLISQRFYSIRSCDTPSMFKDQIKNSSALSDCEHPSTKVH